MSNRPHVDQYMTRMPHTIEYNQSLETAHKLMRKFGIRHLPVSSEKALVGIVSLGDLHLLETLKDVDLGSVTVEEAMTKKPYVVDTTTSVREVAAYMAAHKLGSAIVIDEDDDDGKVVVGIFTTIDALVALLHIFKTVPS